MDQKNELIYERIKDSILTLALSLLALTIGFVFALINAPTDTTVAIYFLTAILTAALTSTRYYGFFTSAILTLGYNFFITAPKFSFSKITPYMLIVSGLMFLMSLISSSIMSRVRLGEQLARRRQKESQVLYHLTKDLSTAETVDEVVELTLNNIADVFNTDCRMVFFDDDGKVKPSFTLMKNHTIQKDVPINSQRDYKEYKEKPPKGYYYNEQQKQYEWPFFDRHQKILGSIAIEEKRVDHFNDFDFRMIYTMTEATGIVIDKLMLSKEQAQAQLEVERERYRTNLLRSISHDLRTPLTGIIGTSELLMELLDENSQEYELASSIYKESSWLSALVANVLSLTRLQNHSMNIKKEVMVVEDVVDSAIETISLRYPERQIVTEYPQDVLTCLVDPALMKQVIINLIDNAIKYSPPTEPIEIMVNEEFSSHNVLIQISDHGMGLDRQEKIDAFKMFYTTKSDTGAKVKRVGLGLPICQSIVKSHDGSLVVSDREDKTNGAVFTIYLPKYDQQTSL